MDKQPALASGMPFIVSSNLDKCDPDTRKLIRRHVMRGKKVKRTDKSGTEGLTLTGSVQKHSAQQTQIRDVIAMYTFLQPGCFGTQLYDYPTEMDSFILREMEQVSTVAMRIMFPLLMELGYHPEGKAWHYPTGSDAAAFHINAFAMQSFIDKVLRHQSDDVVNPVATLHHQKGLKLLQERLGGDDREAKITDATIGVVLKLASSAHFLGHSKISQQHMHGLREMTKLRGGLQMLRGNPKLLVEIWRCDLSIALLTNSDPVFYRHWAEPLPDYPYQVISSFTTGTCSPESMEFIHNLNQDLTEVWLIIRKFCLLANLGTQTRMLIQPPTIYVTMTAVMYRLLGMRFTAGTCDEILRLGILAFTHHIFLQWQDVRLAHFAFCETYRNSLQAHALDDSIPPHVSLWLLMIGAVSLFGVSDDFWLRDYLRRRAKQCGVTSWKEVQEILKASMWISLLDDRPGKQIYDSLIQT